jgi:SAM-dependent methyltransferase
VSDPPGSEASRGRSGLSVAEGDTISGRRPMTHIETNEWVNADHAQGFLDKRDQSPQLEVGYSELLKILPLNPHRVLDLGCGDGKVMAMIGGPGVAVDFSPHMLEQARARFHADDVEVVEHNLNAPLPDLGTFDLAVSAFAIHHCSHERKRQLGWLRDIGFVEVECFWKWRELALLAGRKPPV